MIKGVLIDMSGVLYTGDQPVPGAVEAVLRLDASGVPYRYITNSTRKTKAQLVELLLGLGFPVEPPMVFTPAAAALAWLKDTGHSPHLLVHPNLEPEFSRCAKRLRKAVVVGDAGVYFDFTGLNAAFRELIQGAPFLALAANRVFRDSDGGLSMDAGAFVAALEYASGVKPTILGKPAPAFFAAAAASMGLQLADVAMIGDDAEADVAGALAAGTAAALLVRTGKYSADDEKAYRPKPTATLADIGEAVSYLLASKPA